jgi:mannose-6-phosphate isomerase-like protein (cupin superfamily)
MADAHPTAPRPAAPSGVRPGVLFRHDRPDVTFKQHFVPETANLQFLNCGEYTVPPGAASVTFCRPAEESLLFMWKGAAHADVDGQGYDLSHYDTLYVPRGAGFRLSNASSDQAVIIQCAAPAATAHPVFHSRFAEFSKREDRIRHLAGKDVFLMFDVGEAADKLVAGYTFYQAHTRAWPPHNHTDQEEVYIFIKGHGAMEVYESPEKLTFVHSLNEGDMVTIPYLNYHPVFSQEDPLVFIWCIAGERYWVGDKNKDFMAGKGDSITT